jgi:hypothetical protein
MLERYRKRQIIKQQLNHTEKATLIVIFAIGMIDEPDAMSGCTQIFADHPDFILFDLRKSAFYASSAFCLRNNQ